MKIWLPLMALLLSGSVAAADFRFRVPVKLERIPKGIPQARVVCDVFSYLDTQNPIASGYSLHNINSRRGSLNRMFMVHSDYLPLQPQRVGHQYHCYLQLLVPWATPSWQTPGDNAELEVLQPRENSSLQIETRGTIDTLP